MKVEIIDIASIDFGLVESSEKEKFNLWPVDFNAQKYHTERLNNIPADKVLFFATINNQSIQALLEFQYNDYESQLWGFTCGTVANVYHKPGISNSEREKSINLLFSFLQKFREQKKIKFCFLAVSSWDALLSLAAQQQGFRYMVTWGKCFYNTDRGLQIPEGYRISMEKQVAHLDSFLKMTKDYFRGGRFYLDSAMDTEKTDKMYRDLVTSCFHSPAYDFIVLLNQENTPVAVFISKKQTYKFKNDFEVHGLRFLLSDKKKSPRGIAAPFLNETSRLLIQQATLVDSGIEIHNLPSLKIHNDAGYKFNYVYAGYHSWI